MLRPKTRRMSKDWKKRLEEINKPAFEKQPQLTVLRGRLLSIGGEEVCFAFYEESLAFLLSRGQAFGRTGTMMHGDPNRCHGNTAALYEANMDRTRIATGYALSLDGCWRQHSWGIVNRRKPVETTVRRLAYFGYVLNKVESELFCFEAL